jgi:exopolyphosphatase / guanosine-5'-triphosphate,3'-diphosphate pyrophosphatase
VLTWVPPRLVNHIVSSASAGNRQIAGRLPANGSGTSIPGAVFPLRLAAIDIGSNAIRLLAAEFRDPVRHTRLDSARAPVRLGHDAFRIGQLSELAMDRAIEALSGFRRQMDVLGVSRYRAVATSAVRESSNGQQFVERVLAETGIRIEPISGADEAALVWLAIRHRIDMGSREWILIDVGGGSVEISLATAEEVAWSESHSIGTVRLLEEMSGLDDCAPESIRRLLEDQSAMLRTASELGDGRVEGVIATGGNAEALADLAGERSADGGHQVLSVEQLETMIERFAKLDVAARMSEFGLREDRADVILPAAIFYHSVAARVGASKILVPGVGVRDGVLLDLLEDLVEPVRHLKRLELQITSSALALGRHYRFDENHAKHVARLAIRLFDQLQDLHQLDDLDRRILLAAALLHDIGQFVAYRRHHKHSEYLIANADLATFSPSEIRLVALTARYHRRAEPKEGHEGLVGLTAGEKSRLRMLASILRIADALDRDHAQHVTDVTAVVARDRLLLSIYGEGDLMEEQWALQKKASLFADVFDLEPRFELRR